MSGVGATILEQLGGGKFAAMTGAHGFVSGPNGLSFRIRAANRIKAQAAVITLTGRDDYDLEFVRIRGFDVETVAKHEGVGCENLRSTFTAATGLETAL